MRDYELMLILDPTLEAEEHQKATDRVAKLIDKNDGKVEKVDVWGTRRLAYPIAGHSDGYYAIMLFRGENSTIDELDRVLKIADEVMRHLIVRQAESQKVSA